MTIQTGRGKRRGARAGLGTGKRGNGSTQRDSKAVARFAPNFSVYVLPPDVVCLYSEDRKFFLHGALYCALAAADRRRQERGPDRPRAGKGLSLRPDPRSTEAACRPPLRRSGAARVGGPRRRLLGEPRHVAGGRECQSAELSCAHRVDRRAGRQGARRRAESAGRSRRAGRRRPDRHAGERLSRGAAGRIEPAALVGPHALAPGPALRHFSPGGAGVQPGQQSDQDSEQGSGQKPAPEPLLDLSRRAHEPQSRGQGVPRPQAGPPRCGFAARPRPVRTERHRSRVDRDREGDRDRLSHRPERSHRQPRSTWARPSRGITWRRVRNVRPAAARRCAIPAGRRCRSSSAPAAKWS